MSDSPEPDCGCAPTAEERSAFTRGSSTLSRRLLLGAGALGFVGLAALAGPMIPAAFAADYPSWDDVERARANEASKASEVTRIQGLIADLQNDVIAKQAEAERLGNEYFMAREAYLIAAERVVDLQTQADEQAALAASTSDSAARVAQQIYRNGGDDVSLELFFSDSAENADNLLSSMGTMDQLLGRNRDVYAEAVTARNNAQSLSDQAAEARNERDRLQKEAEAKMLIAQEAANAAAAALELQKEHIVVLQAQLAALQDATVKTIADYQAGVEAERKEQEERERQARIEAERLAAAAAAQMARDQAAAAAAAAEAAKNNANSGGGGGGGYVPPAPVAPPVTAGGSVVGSGWARPSSGWKTSDYGDRGTICSNGSCTTGHRGVDLASGCGSGIFSAANGTVVDAGWRGDFGNHIRISHGNGVETGYSHIQGGGILVSVGQWVSAGQLIAREGNTGLSQGCHLHFEVYLPGGRINPNGWMNDRGVWL